MKIFVHQLVDSTFTNDDGGVIAYSNAFCQDSQHQNNKEYKGQGVLKMKTQKGLIDTVDANHLPGWFDYEFMPANGGRIIITSLKHVQK